MATTMEVAKVLVGLDGSTDTQVPKYDVTPAEALLLRRIHGGVEAVSDVTITGTTARSARDEVLRLAKEYPARNDEGKTLVEELFGGLAPFVPTTFAEIGIEDEAPAPAATAPKARRVATPKIEEATVLG